MFKSLYFKIVLILLVFIIAVMCSVGAILLSGVTSYYVENFAEQMTECFDEGGILMPELKQAAQSERPASEMKNVRRVSAAYLVGVVIKINSVARNHGVEVRHNLLTFV